MFTIDARDLPLDSAWRVCIFSFVLENDGAGSMTITSGGATVATTTNALDYPEEAWAFISNFYALCTAEAGRRSRQAAEA